jgi:predicted Zn-dependent peptidase
MTRLGKNAVTGGELLSVDEVVRRIDAVDLESTSRVAADVLDRERVLAMIGPYSAEDVAHLVG